MRYLLDTTELLGRRVYTDEDGYKYTFYNSQQVFVIPRLNPYNIGMAANCNNDIIITEDVTVMPNVAIETLVLHEIGHLRNGHTDESDLTYEEYRFERYMANKKNRIFYQEKQADDNVVYELGKDGAIIGFTMVAEFQEEHYGNISNVDEIYRRIKRIERIPEWMWTIKKWWNSDDIKEKTVDVRNIIKNTKRTIRKFKMRGKM